MVEIDTDRIDEAVLALLYLTPHDRFRAWKGSDWDVMDRLHRTRLIYDPVGKAKSVVLTDEGLAKSERRFKKLFARPLGIGRASCLGYGNDQAGAAGGSWMFQGRSSSRRLMEWPQAIRSRTAARYASGLRPLSSAD